MATKDDTGGFAGKVAFVTGAANGIGRATALAFSREGARVVVADVSETKNHDTARMIQELGGHARAVTCDVSRSDDVQRALNATIDAFGRLDFAFNNAGIEYAIKPAADVTEEECHLQVDVERLHRAPDGIDRLQPFHRRVDDLEWRDVFERNDRARPALRGP